jgi:hypothetical protein
MAKATLTLPDGTTVLIEGSAEEIARIMSLHSTTIQAQPSHHPSTTKPKKPKITSKKSSQSGAGPKQRIFELKSLGFFDEKKSIVDIQKKLEEQGHIYAQTSLSPALVRLVRSKDLRRVKEDKVWMYVNP